MNVAKFAVSSQTSKLTYFCHPCDVICERPIIKMIILVDDEDEVGTENKLLVVGGENGIVAILNLRSREILRQTKLDFSVNCVKFFSSQLCLVGGSGK